MKIKFLTGLFLVLGIVCMISYRIIGSEVGPDGVLNEPFFLIPLGYLFFFLSIIFGVIVFLKKQ